MVAFLEGCGLDVWWDEALVARGAWKPQLYRELAEAAVVVVLWTKEAVDSDWVKLEADYASAPGRNMIVHVVDHGLKAADLPDPYKTVQYHRPDETGLILRDVLATRAGHLLLQFKREALPVDGVLPTMLLQAKYGVVPFIDSEGALADTVDWALAEGVHATSPRRAAGRLVHGPGGLGKTRLLIEVAEALRQRGWSAGFIARPEAKDTADERKRYAEALRYLIRDANDNGLLLVMDYAEGRPDEVARLCDQIRNRPPEVTRTIRLVLLTRGAGDWWTRLRDENPAVATLFRPEAGVSAVIAIQDMTSARQRLELFWSAFREFAAILPDNDYPTPPHNMDATRLQRIETGEGYERPLAIQMEALLYLAAATPG